MADEIKYRNLVQRNDESISSFKAKVFGADNKGPIDEVRENMKEQYGWLSPYEYYYGSPDEAGEEVERTSLMPVFTPQALGLTEEETEDLFAEVEAAEKDNIPNWFWVDSLSNWCYIKPSFLDNSGVIGSDTTWVGDFLKTYAGVSMVLGNPVGAIIAEVILQSAEGNLDEWYVSIPTGLVVDWYDVSMKPIELAEDFSKYTYKIVEDIYTPIARITGGWDFHIAETVAGLADAAQWVTENLGVTALVAALVSLVRMFFNESTADADSEALIELIQTGGDPAYRLSRNCLSTYMWNGFTRSWMPLKWMIEIYDTYMKRPNRGLLRLLFEEENQTKRHEIVAKISSHRSEYLNTIVPEFLRNSEVTSKDDSNTISGIVEAYNNAWTNWDSNHDDASLIAVIKELFGQVWNGYNYIGRSAFLQTFTFDPACLEAFTTRSPLNKMQIIATQAWNKRRPADGFENCRWLENWGMWLPLPNEKAKIRLYANSTFQLINRPYNSFKLDQYVTRGNIHTNVGHPCFMRGNDNVLWMSYWLRWTSTTGSKSTRHSTAWGLVTTGHTYSQVGMSDISDKDIENWDAIINSMFEKHDEYGFEDWMINGNYKLSYPKFTIDEESPTDVSSFEESELNPEKVPIVNSIDWVPKSQMVLRLSDNTVVNRDDKNGMSHAAKRW